MKQPNYTFDDYLKAAMLQYLKDGNYNLVKWKRKPGGKIKIEIQDHLAKNEKKQGGFINGFFGLFERKRTADSSNSSNGNSLCMPETKEQKSNSQSAIEENCQTRKENEEANQQSSKGIRESESRKGEAGRTEKGECKE